MWPIKTITEQLPHGVGRNSVYPHVFGRSGIFTTVSPKRHGRRHYTQRIELSVLGAMTVYQMYGYQLDQHDADVMYELLSMVFRQGDSNLREARVRFRRIDMLQALGRETGGKSRKVLDESLERLTLATYELQIPGVLTGISRLILKAFRRDKGELDDPGADYEVLLDLELGKLFLGQEWSTLSYTERSQLMDDPLARGLHAYYTSHAKPFPVFPASLKALTGRTAMREDKWIAALKSSLARLKTATGWAVCELSTTGRYAGKVVVVKKKAATKKAITKPAAKSVLVPTPKAASVDAATTPSSALARLTRADLYVMSQADAEALMPASMLKAWRTTLEQDAELANDPGAQRLNAVGQIIRLWEEEQRRINPQIAAELDDI